jgi:hypothetical protein
MKMILITHNMKELIGNKIQEGFNFVLQIQNYICRAQEEVILFFKTNSTFK